MNNLFISARAGSGKTTRLAQLAAATSPSQRVLALSFSRPAAEELSKRMPAHVDSSTFNSCGNKILLNMQGYRKVNEDKLSNILYFDLCNKDSKLSRAMRPAIALCALAKCQGWSSSEANPSALASLADEYCLDLPDSEKVDEAQFFSCAEKLYSTSLARPTPDFNDQILLPTLSGYTFPYYDVIMVDEAQDLNQAQMRFLAKFKEANPSVHYIFVGDPFQAIYGFRGSHVAATDQIIQQFGCEVETMPVCHRCSKAVITAAQKIVTDIAPSPEAVAGRTGSIEYHELPLVEKGSFILCRTRAPLVKLAIELLRKAVPFQLRAMPDWEPIKELHEEVVAKYEGQALTISAYLPMLEDLATSKSALFKAKGKRSAAAKLMDSYEVLAAVASLLEPTAHPSLIMDDLADLEQESDLKVSAGGIILSTIHRAKGLEANNVYLLRPDLLPHPLAEGQWQKMQERNLHYVAITRARVNYYRVNLTDAERAAVRRSKYGINADSPELALDLE